MMPHVELLGRWGVARDAVLVAAERGSNNQSFVVTAPGGRWVLRISENLSLDEVRAEHRLLARLRGAGLPFEVPQPVTALDGRTVIATAAGPATLCRWIPGVRPDLADERAIEGFGRTLGLLSQALRPVPPADAPHDWRVNPLRAHPDAPGIDELCRSLTDSGVREEQAALLKTAASRVAAWWPAAAAQLPVQVVHGDMVASNMLVDPHTGEVTGVLDFEIAGTDFAVTDLAVGLLQSGVLYGPRWQRHVGALVHGYVSVSRLSRAELCAVPELFLCRAVGSVLWRAARWRRGQVQLSEVATRLTRLEAIMYWLTTSREEFLTLMATG
jgi:homoserine kinase type II